MQMNDSQTTTTVSLNQNNKLCTAVQKKGEDNNSPKGCKKVTFPKAERIQIQIVKTRLIGKNPLDSVNVLETNAVNLKAAD